MKRQDTCIYLSVPTEKHLILVLMCTMQVNKEFQKLMSKRTNFLNTVRFKLQHLNVDFLKIEKTYLNSKNISHLIKVFKLEKCWWLNKEHYIPVIINQRAFQDALTAFQVHVNELFNPMSDNPPQKLRLPSDMWITYLHSQHHLAAAHQFLCSDDKWWMVSLYSDGMHIFLPYIELSDCHHKNCQMTSARTWLMISSISSHFMMIISFIIYGIPKCKETHKSQSTDEQGSVILNTRIFNHFNIRRSIHSSVMH